jgi:hypothetical protein
MRGRSLLLPAPAGCVMEGEVVARNRVMKLAVNAWANARSVIGLQYNII